MGSDTIQRSRDWLRTPRTSLLVRWIPKAAILAGLLVPLPFGSSRYSEAGQAGREDIGSLSAVSEPNAQPTRVEPWRKYVSEQALGLPSLIEAR
jgi:hypothetical protein